jgi:peptidoglycan hydrolase-like protein with peptidoglycan-binding domain
MRVTKAIPLGLALLVAAGQGVFAVAAQTSTQKKPGTTKSGGASHSKKSSKKSSRSRRERGQKAPTPERISEIQQALAKNGAYTGNPNGKWDASTVDAMKRFQDSHGLNPTGKLDAKTLQQLGLGSATAGVAAPLPPVSSSAVKTPPPQSAQRQ